MKINYIQRIHHLILNISIFIEIKYVSDKVCAQLTASQTTTKNLLFEEKKKKESLHSTLVLPSSQAMVNENVFIGIRVATKSSRQQKY